MVTSCFAHDQEVGKGGTHSKNYNSTTKQIKRLIFSLHLLERKFHHRTEKTYFFALLLITELKREQMQLSSNMTGGKRMACKKRFEESLNFHMFVFLFYSTGLLGVLHKANNQYISIILLFWQGLRYQVALLYQTCDSTRQEPTACIKVEILLRKLFFYFLNYHSCYVLSFLFTFFFVKLIWLMSFLSFPLHMHLLISLAFQPLGQPNALLEKFRKFIPPFEGDGTVTV